MHLPAGTSFLSVRAEFGTCSETEEINGHFEYVVLKTVPLKLRNDFLFCTMLGSDCLMVRKETSVFCTAKMGHSEQVNW